MAERTSETDPIQIAWVPCLGGDLGLTFCPGKQGPSEFGEAWRRDLDTDLAAVRDAGAGALVTLMEEDECAHLGVAEIGTRAEAHGLEWIHLPIVDLRVPDSGFERHWPLWSQAIRARLQRGDKVVLHCRGGRGRTGTIAARLLVEAGLAPGEAIDIVRAARPGTIETKPQEAHVRAARAMAGDADWRDRSIGCLVGGAVGDAFGYAVEFLSLAEIRRRHGEAGLRAPVPQGGRLVVSDDTQMTLFTAEGLLDGIGDAPAASAEGEAILEAIRRATLRWYRTQTSRYEAAGAGLLAHSQLWARRAPGNTCMSASDAGARGTPESPVNDSKGCGGVMRVAAVGLVPAFSPERAFELAARAAAQTHGHPSGYLSAGAMAAILRCVIGGERLDAAARRACDIAAGWPGADETVAAIRGAMEAAPTDDPRMVARLGQGWVGEEALAIGLFAVRSARNFAGALAIAANHDGDSDSTASIAGQLWGAAHGLAGIPAAWIRALDVIEPLASVVARWTGAEEALRRR